MGHENCLCTIPFCGFLKYPLVIPISKPGGIGATWLSSTLGISYNETRSPQRCVQWPWPLPRSAWQNLQPWKNGRWGWVNVKSLSVRWCLQPVPKKSTNGIIITTGMTSTISGRYCARSHQPKSSLHKLSWIDSCRTLFRTEFQKSGLRKWFAHLNGDWLSLVLYLSIHFGGYHQI